MNGNIVRRLEQKAIGFPTASMPTAYFLTIHPSSSNQPRQRSYSIEKRVETLVAHPLPMTFPLTSRTSFVAVDV